MPAAKGYRSERSKEIDQYIIDTWRTHTVDEQSAALGLARQSILRRRSLLLRTGRVKAEERVTRRAWSDAEAEQIIELFETGSYIDAIARKVRRDPAVIYSLLRRQGVLINQLRNGCIRVFSIRSAARALGVNCERFRLYVHRGWGPVAKRPRLKRNHRHTNFLIYEMDLIEWMEDPRSWTLWEVRDISDPVLREVAEECRADPRRRWLTTEEVGRRFGYHASTVHGWIISGHLPALQWTKGYPYFIWAPDLDDFEVPLGIWKKIDGPGRYVPGRAHQIRPPSILKEAAA